MVSTPRLRHSSAFIAYALAAACSSRSVPSAWPESAAASPSAPSAPVAEVIRSLASEPPLPGEAAAGWAGLDAPVSPDEHAGHEHGAVYTCPMHPDVVSDAPGKCPRCGMNLVKQDAPK
jgi:hypothetical protein